MKIHKKQLFLLPLVALALVQILCPAAEAQSLWKDDGPKANLIADNVAHRKGDILTILISENHKVEDKQDVKLEKTDSLDSALTSFNIAENAFDPLPDVKQETTKDFQGKADYDKEGKFTAKISVTVIDKLPNGNLVVEGRRHIFKDDEEQAIKITGTVRPLDISQDNTVLSEKVSDARVSYDGEGELSTSTEKSWFSKFIDVIWPF